ncbi:hypothetical protein SCB71_14000 [Herbiconiux sp. KACC 21604]|uniref:hypothetical protein n=1 Tax=unclassified Herbiconiux TaxID=2618217 RepID=UPI0014928FE3|nr:hypothetical protein [Herbiconiux sp. SALV-R1]QJU52192.1 hypothetical protein HL652_11945 [Herbiconiux sp. SALV-R1]WPO85324.1 hypothetical protein SCB71_14000 [Herbiconiux sp. KACC 21604]
MRDDERMRQADEQERRAHETLASIGRGGDLGAETLALSNEFTDRQTARLGAWLRRFARVRRAPDAHAPADDAHAHDHADDAHPHANDAHLHPHAPADDHEEAR